MIKPHKKSILQLAIRAGEIMMSSGAEIYRVEDTIRRICLACHVPIAECFALATGLFVSIIDDDDKDSVFTMVKRVRGGATDLKKLSEINTFSRIFTTTDMTVEEGLVRLEEINKSTSQHIGQRILGAALVSTFYCGIFSANIPSSICALFIGLISYILSIFLSKYETNYFVKGFFCCATATLLAVLCSYFGLAPDYGSMVIGTMMLFVPGAAITNSIRDLLSGDMISGLGRMSEALIIAVSLASGAGIVITLLGIIGLTRPPTPDIDLALWIEVLLGAASTLGFSLILNAPKKSIIPILLIGSAGWASYLSVTESGNGKVIGCFAGACAVGFLSGICSRWLKEAATVFIIPSIMTLVPGAGMYYTMLVVITGDYSRAASTGTQTLFMAGAIALGIMVTSGSFIMFTSIKRRSKVTP